MKKCPNCNKTYRDFDQYCSVCRYKLKYIEGSEKIEYTPEPTGNAFINPTIRTKQVITCPYCQSTNTKKISTISKAGSVAMFGVFAMGKVSKQWKCSDCKSEF